MSYRIAGLSPELFAHLWPLDEAALDAQSIRRVVADSDRGFPCRVSLDNARAGETLLLMPFQHHDVAGPYRASGPIFVREQATRMAVFENRIPEFFLRRLLSVRAYDANGWMQASEVVEGTQLAQAIESFFERDDVDYLHLHNARPGCFAARVDRH